jgi:hypothetical protein
LSAVKLPGVRSARKSQAAPSYPWSLLHAGALHASGIGSKGYAWRRRSSELFLFEIRERGGDIPVRFTALQPYFAKSNGD